MLTKIFKKLKLHFILFINDRSNSLINNLIYIVIGLSLFFLTINSMYYLILFIPYLIFLFKKIKRNIIYILIVLIIISFIHVSILNHIYTKTNINLNSLYGHIIDIEEKNDYYRLKVKNKLTNYYIYINSINDLRIGDYAIFNGKVNIVSSNNIKNAFDYKFYLQTNKIKYSFNASEVNVLKHSFSIYVIKYNLIRYIDNKILDSKSNTLIKGLLLGDNSGFDEDTTNALKENGIVHLFAVSGLHISLLIMIISKILKLFKLKDNYIELIISIFLIMYLIITSFTPSILRCSLMYFLSLINKNKMNNIFTSLDICSLSFIILILVNPYYIYQNGFKLSYLASLSIILFSNLLSKYNKYIQIFFISIITNIITLPLIINLNNEINILSPILNILYITLTSSIIIPISFIVLIFPFFSNIYKYISDFYLLLINNTRYFNISLRLPHFYPITIIIYIIIILLFIIYFKNKKLRYIISLIFISYIIFLHNINYFNYKDSVYFMYLNDGEASVIRNKNHTVLIDTGDGYNNEVYKYLMNEGIYSIDAIFISHNHNDHDKGLDYINSNLKVKRIFINEYNKGKYSNYENTFILNSDDCVKIGEMSFYIINPKIDMLDENSNSMVIYFKLNNHSILFTGDMTIENEHDVINTIKKNNFDIEFLKVAHHGSNTSTSLDFIKNINPKYSVIMVSNKWKDTFPNQIVLKNLYKYSKDVYITLSYYSFEFRFTKTRIIFYPLKV